MFTIYLPVFFLHFFFWVISFIGVEFFIYH